MKKAAEVQEALAHIYNDQCGVVQSVQFLNPKTLFGYENEDWEARTLKSSSYKTHILFINKNKALGPVGSQFET